MKSTNCFVLVIDLGFKLFFCYVLDIFQQKRFFSKKKKKVLKQNLINSSLITGQKKVTQLGNVLEHEAKDSILIEERRKIKMMKNDRKMAKKHRK